MYALVLDSHARIDMIPIDSEPLIIEIELIDPMLFFDLVPRAQNTGF